MQLRDHHLLNRIRTYIVGGRTSATIGSIIGAVEVLNGLVWVIDVKPQGATAIGTIEQAAKHILLAVLLLWSAAFCLCYKLLYHFKGLTVNDRLVNVLEYRPIFFGIIKTFLVTEGL